MASAPVATLIETRTAVVKTYDSLKRDASGKPIPSWKEECRSTFSLQIKSEAVGCNDKSASLLLVCPSFHQELFVPLTLKWSDTHRIRTNQPHFQQLSPEVQLMLSLAKPNILGYKCSVPRVTQNPLQPEPQAPPNPPANAGAAQANFGYVAPMYAYNPPQPLFGAAPQRQPVATQCTPGENGSWKIVAAPGKSISLSLEILLESPKSGDGAPVQSVAGMLQGAQETGDLEIQSKVPQCEGACTQQSS